MAVVTATDRPKSVCNRCLIELFCGVVCVVVTLPFCHFCWCRGFCHRTGSDLLLFVSFCSLRVQSKKGINAYMLVFVACHLNCHFEGIRRFCISVQITYNWLVVLPYFDSHQIFVLQTNVCVFMERRFNIFFLNNTDLTLGQC